MNTFRYLALALIALPLSAEASAWIDFNGTIPGEATEANHNGWIEILGFSALGEIKPGASGSFGLSKMTDSASPKLFLAAASAKKIPRATLHLVMNDPLKPYEITLEEILVTKFETSLGNSETRPVEQVGLSFRKITYKYILERSGAKIARYDYFTGQASESENPPQTTDSDGDGMDDEWEILHGFKVGINDSAGDADGDGLSNLNEYLLGTDPKSGESFFQATLDTASADGKMDLTWNTVQGKVYLVQWTPDLKVPFSTIQEVVGGINSTTVRIPRESSVGFYRVTPKP